MGQELLPLRMPYDLQAQIQVTGKMKRQPMVLIRITIANDWQLLYEVRGMKLKRMDFSEERNVQVDVSNFDAALYLVKIHTENGAIIKRVIKI